MEAQRSEAAFAELLNAVPDAMLVTSAEGAILLANRQAEVLFGYTREELTGLLVEALIPERYGAEHVGHRLRYMEAPRVRPMGAGLELYALTKDGNEVPVEISLSPSSLDGELVVISTIRDVSDRKRIEADRARLYEEAREAVQLRNEFLSAISHDLGNPVAAIRLESRLLKNAVAEPGRQGELLEGLGQIEAAATHMWKQVEELLDLARLQVGRALELNWKPLDLLKLVAETIQVQQATTSDHRIELVMDVPGLQGEWDATRLERVFTNLLSNAIKYSPGGGEIVVRVQQQRGEDAASSVAVIEVQDSGIGIPAADLPHIFERFHRAGNARGRFAGTGIGLAGAQQIVNLHGGEITVVSEEGAGTTVTVRLPLEAAGADEREE